MARKPKAKSNKQRGGQPGNKNAQRHGFYAKSFEPDELKQLDDAEQDLQSEINLIRISISKLYEQISYDPVLRTDNNGADFRDAHYLNQLNTLLTMTVAISTLTRSQFLLKGKGGETRTSIMDALEDLRIELGMPL